MSDFARHISRSLLSFTFIWLLYIPLLPFGFDRHVIPAAGAALGAGLVLFSHRRAAAVIGALILAACASAILALSRGRWLLPPAWMGISAVIYAAAMIMLKPPHTVDAPAERSRETGTGPLPVLRFAVFYLTWCAGLIITACFPRDHAPIIFLGWTCFMYLAANAVIWPYAVSPEWLGYKTRRSCFVSTKIWRLRAIAAAAICTAWIIILFAFLI